jgi:hypothetical protein
VCLLQVIYPSRVDWGDGRHLVTYSPRFTGKYHINVELAQRGIGSATAPGGLTGAYYNDRRVLGPSRQGVYHSSVAVL